MRAALAFAAVLSLSAALGATSSRSQEWPTHPVTMVVPFPPGGGADVLGRILSRRMSEILGQPVVIDNVGGAGGMIGGNRVAKAPPDGNQFLLGSRADAINQTLYKHPLYDLKEELAPVVLIAEQPNVLVARKDLPVDDLKGFIAYVKKNHATLRFGSPGIGSTGYVDCALFDQAIGVEVQQIPYRGGGPALQDLIGRQFDYLCALAPTAIPPIQSNLIKGIAVLDRERLPSLPKVATAKEQGMDFEGTAWFAFYLPKGTPARIIKRLHDATVTAIEAPAVQEQLAATGTFVVPADQRSTEYLQKFIATEIEKNAGPLRAAGMSIE